MPDWRDSRTEPAIRNRKCCTSRCCGRSLGLSALAKQACGSGHRLGPSASNFRAAERRWPPPPVARALQQQAARAIRRQSRVLSSATPAGLGAAAITARLPPANGPGHQHVFGYGTEMPSISEPV